MSIKSKLYLTGITLLGLGMPWVSYTHGLPDCDGSIPLTDWCGTKIDCPAPEQNPQTLSWYCPNQAIVQQFIQHKCTPSQGLGSTLCGEPSSPEQLVCTKRYDCVYEEILDPDTGMLIARLCARDLLDDGNNNSYASKKELLPCRDTSGGG